LPASQRLNILETMLSYRDAWDRLKITHRAYAGERKLGKLIFHYWNWTGPKSSPVKSLKFQLDHHIEIQMIQYVLFRVVPSGKEDGKLLSYTAKSQIPTEISGTPAFEKIRAAIDASKDPVSYRGKGCKLLLTLSGEI
jgi:hypothetical protein